MSNRILKLDSNQQQCWLNQHLPNRVCAAWVRLPDIKGEWKCQQEHQLGPADFSNLDPNEVWCICRSVEHGRKAAIRWLIEFVGISLNGKGELYRPLRRTDMYGNPRDVSIQSFVPQGSTIDLQISLNDNRSSCGWVLADVWKGISQSTGHATDKTRHPLEDPQALAKAFLIVVDHLETKLYGSGGGKKLIEIVRALK